MIEAVIFDCDGVLVDSEVLGLEVELALLAEIGLHYDPDEYKTRFLGGPWRLWRDGVEGDYRARFDRPFPEGFHARAMKAHHEAVEGDRLRAVAGVTDALASLDRAKAVASSSGVRGLRNKLTRTALAAHFDPHIYSTELVEHGKPAPDLFLLAAEKLAVAPARCLVIEDSANGVRAGRAAGMEVWGFIGGGHCGASAPSMLRDAGAHRIVADWREAAALFAAF